MRYFVYILFSESAGRYYIGTCADLRKRLREHNKGLVKSTKAYQPWKLVLIEEFKNITDARKRELKIKSYKGGNAFKRLLHG